MHNNNEHGYACDTFMKLRSPHRWSCVRVFMEDGNGTVEIGEHFVMDETIRLVSGFGPNPSVLAEQLDGSDFRDTIANVEGWDGTRRRLISHLTRTAPREEWDGAIKDTIGYICTKHLFQDAEIPYPLLSAHQISAIYSRCLAIQRSRPDRRFKEKLADLLYAIKSLRPKKRQ